MTTPSRTRRRLSLAMIVVVAVVGVFVVRLVDIQVVRASELNTESLNKRAVSTVTYAARGDIVDKNGVVLAGSIMRYDVTVSPKVVASLRAPSFTRGSGDDEVEVTFAEAAAEIAQITGQTQNDVLLTFTGDPTSDFEYITKKVTLEQMRKIRDLRIPGIYSQSHPARIYPGGAVAGTDRRTVWSGRRTPASTARTGRRPMNAVQMASVFPGVRSPPKSRSRAAPSPPRSITTSTTRYSR